MSHVAWINPSVPGAATFAQWNGANVALVRKMADGTWRAAVFPDGDTCHDVDARVPTESFARKMVERWLAVNHGRITAQARDPSFKGCQFMPRKPQGEDGRS
jgi:hypothetical protein